MFGETGAAPFNFFCWFRVQLELIGTVMHKFGVHESYGILISGNDSVKVRVSREVSKSSSHWPLQLLHHPRLLTLLPFAQVLDAVKFVQPRIQGYLEAANALHPSKSLSWRLNFRLDSGHSNRALAAFRTSREHVDTL